jgi:hypothetical protein
VISKKEMKRVCKSINEGLLFIGAIFMLNNVPKSSNFLKKYESSRDLWR